MKSLLRRCNIITGGTWQWQKSEPRSYDAGISQPWCVPFCLQLCSSIKSTASVQGPGGRTLSSVTLSSVCKSKLLWTEETCWCRHCTRQLIVFTQTLYTQRDSLSIFTGLYQHSMPTVCACVLNALCVVYRSCFLGKGQVLCDLKPAAFCSYLSHCLLDYVIPSMTENIRLLQTFAAFAVQRKHFLEQLHCTWTITVAGALTFTAPCWACCFPAHKINYPHPLG